MLQAYRPLKMQSESELRHNHFGRRGLVIARDASTIPAIKHAYLLVPCDKKNAYK